MKIKFAFIIPGQRPFIPGLSGKKPPLREGTQIIKLMQDSVWPDKEQSVSPRARLSKWMINNS